MNFHFKFGLVCDTKPGYVKVVFKEDDNATTDWLPLLVKTSMTDKESWFLNIDEQVCVICNQDMHEGAVLGSIHSDPDCPDSGAAQGKFRKVFEDGTFLEYDKNTHILTASVQGDVSIQAKTASVQADNITAKGAIQTTITSPAITLQGDVTIAGNLSAGSLTLSADSGADGKIHGNIQVEGSVQASEVEANGVPLSAHLHSGVTTGSGFTGNPVA